jgi:tetratricopeptide (TPR) repeat protein
MQASSDAYEEAINLEPGIMETYVNLSVIYFEQNRFEEAVDVIREGIEESPEEPELYYRMVVYLVKMGKYKDAFSYLENALTLDFDRHTILYELMPELKKQKAIYKIIAQYRDNHPLP